MYTQESVYTFSDTLNNQASHCDWGCFGQKKLSPYFKLIQEKGFLKRNRKTSRDNLKQRRLL